MKKGRIIRYAANTALLAVLAAAGIGVYQLGTSGTDEKMQERYPSYYDEGMMMGSVPDNTVDAGTDLVENGNSTNKQNEKSDDTFSESTLTDDTTFSSKQSQAESVNTSANVQEMPKLNFSEDTLMKWPVDGNILMDYNMDQTVYFPTLDQYKLSPAISVQAVEGAPVMASVQGNVYAIENSAQTGTTVTMEIGSGYQAIYGQLTDLTVEEGDTVKEGEIIGYVAAPTKYYSKEGSNLYFAMKKNGEPIAYLP